MTKPGAPRIVVIGAGITGAFTAYFLARAGALSTVVERGPVGGEASSHNAGGLNPLHGPGIPGPMQELALASLRLHRGAWPELSRLSGQGFGGRVVPRLTVAFDPEEASALSEARELYEAEAGFGARLLTGAGLRLCEPLLGPNAVAGLLTEGNARVDSGAYTRAVVAAARQLGARFVRGEATGLRQQNGRVSAVRLDGGSDVACDGVVIATGPWCEAPGRWLSLSLPVEPVKGELLLVESGASRPSQEVTWGGAGVYAGPRDCLWLGGTEDRVGFDRSSTTHARERILAGVRRVLPRWEVGRVVEHIAGLRPLTPDGLPILGIPSGWENVCLALGSGRKGMLYGAGLGRAAAELTIDGATAVPIGPCSPERMAVSA